MGYFTCHRKDISSLTRLGVNLDSCLRNHHGSQTEAVQPSLPLEKNTLDTHFLWIDPLESALNSASSLKTII